MARYVLRKGGPIKGKPGLVLRAGKGGARRWQRVHPEEVRPGGAWETPRGHIRVHKVEGGEAELRTHHGPDDERGGAPYRMPAASVPHHIHDSRRYLPPMDASGDPAIDAVIDGRAEYIGKGNDGIVYQADDKAVKLSTTTPYQWENPGHRTPEGAVGHLRKEHDAHKALAGLPMIPEITGREHAGRYWLVKPWLEVVKTGVEGSLTIDELRDIEAAVAAIHEKGWALGDEPQVGRDEAGRMFFFDLGLARPDPGQQARDLERLDDLFKYQGHRRLPTGKALIAEEEKLRAMVERGGAFLRVYFDRWKELAEARAADLHIEMMQADDEEAIFEEWMALQDKIDTLKAQHAALPERPMKKGAPMSKPRFVIRSPGAPKPHATPDARIVVPMSKARDEQPAKPQGPRALHVEAALVDHKLQALADEMHTHRDALKDKAVQAHAEGRLADSKAAAALAYKLDEMGGAIRYSPVTGEDSSHLALE